MDYWVICDGSSKGDGSGGYGAVIVDQDKNVKVLSQGYRNTTNNRMEIMAVLKAMEYLPPGSSFKLICDSQYVLNTLSKGWLLSWIVSDFEGKKNADLWRQIAKLLPKFKNCTTHWIKGHQGHYYNELADSYASLSTELNLLNDGD